jgi:uncharacterized integral membrane protein
MILVVLVILLVAVVTFSVQNPGRVDVEFLAWEFRSPLLLVGLVIFALGVLAGVSVMTPYYFRRRMEARRLRKDIVKERERTLPESPPTNTVRRGEPRPPESDGPSGPAARHPPDAPEG